jgi:hypothetical protein
MSTNQFVELGSLHLANPAPALPELVILDKTWEDTQGPYNFREISKDLRLPPFSVSSNATAALVQIKVGVRTHTTVPGVGEGTAAVAIRTVPSSAGEYVAYAAASKATEHPGDMTTPRDEAHVFVPVLLQNGTFEIQCDYSIRGYVKIALVIRLVGYYS